MSLDPQKKEIAFVAMTVALSTDSDAQKQKFLSALAANPDPSALHENTRVKRVLTAIPTELYTEVHKKIFGKPDLQKQVGTQLINLENSLNELTSLLRDEPEYRPAEICPFMEQLMTDISKA
jgi:hypothetical protein